MDINVKKVMAESKDENERFYKGVRPEINHRDAFRRLEMLKDMLQCVSDAINEVPVGTTEQDWIDAYELLNKAFNFAINEEKRIIARA